MSQADNRSSINPMNSSRMSFSRAEESKRRDPTILRDKQNVYRLSIILEDFLKNNCYTGKISKYSSNITPAVKEVQEIFKFLFSFIDTSFLITNKHEEDITNILKLLKYPYISEINKSMLTASTPHTWPVILSALHWLIELVDYLKNSSIKLEEKSNNIDVINPMFYDFVCKGYIDFLNNKEDSSLDEEFIKSVEELSENKYGNLEIKINDLQKLEDKIIQMESDSKMFYEDYSKTDISINTSRANESSISEKRNNNKMTKKQYLLEKFKELEKEEKKIIEMIEINKSKQRNLNLKLEKIQNETEKQNKVNDELKHEVINLEELVRKQAITPQQVEKLYSDKNKIHNELEEIKPIVENKVKELKEEKENIFLQMEELTIHLNNLKNELNEDIPLKIIKEGKDYKENVKLVGDILEYRKTLEDRINEIKLTILELDDEINSLEARDEDLAEGLKKAKEECEYTEKEQFRISKFYIHQKDLFEQNKKIINTELESLKDIIMKDQNERSTEVFILGNEIEKMKIKIEKAKKNYEQEKEQINKIIYDLNFELKKMLNEVENEIKELDFLQADEN